MRRVLGAIAGAFLVGALVGAAGNDVLVERRTWMVAGEGDWTAVRVLTSENGWYIARSDPVTGSAYAVLLERPRVRLP